MQLPKLDVKKSIILIISFLVITLTLVGGLALWQLNSIAHGIQNIYANSVIPLKLLRSVSDGYAVSIVDSTNKYHLGAIDNQQALTAIRNAKEEIRANWKNYLSIYTTPAEKALINIAEHELAHADIAIADLESLIIAENRREVDFFIREQLYQVVEPISKTMNKIKDVQVELAQAQLVKSQHDYRQTIFIAIALSVLLVVVSGLLVLQLVRRFLHDRHKNESSALRTSKVYSALARLNHALPAMHTHDDLVQRFCEFLTDVGGVDAAYIVLKQHGKSHIVGASGVASNLVGTEVLDKASGMVGDIPPYTLVPIYARHYIDKADDGMDPSLLMSLAPHFGFEASAMFNILRGGLVLGTINLYSKEMDFFDEAILMALDEAANDLSALIDHLDARKAQQLVEHKANLHRMQFQQVFESSPLAMVLSTFPDNVVINANPAFCMRLSTHYAQVVGRNIKSLGVKVNAKQEAIFLKEIKTKGRVSNFEVVMQFDQAEKRDVLINAEILEFDDKLCMLQVFNDISDRKRLIEAESANQAKTAFLSHLSHELKTPLNAVIGFAGLLKMSSEDPLTEKQYDSVNRIQNAGVHLNSIIADLIDIARIEAGQISLVLEPTDVSECLSAAVSMCQKLADDTKVQIEMPYLQEKSLLAKADSRRLQQILINFISNAIKYNREGGRVVLQVNQDSKQVHIAVQDNGIGMNAMQLSQLFEPFNRLGQEKTNVDGMGVGLSLSKQLAQLMGGDIQVDSKKGQGSTFKVSLALANTH
jgi:signal transduction histidine kinase